MRSIQAGAIAGGYVDIEYTYMVDVDGLVYVCRGPGKDSAATMDHNSVSHAICVMGNFENDPATDLIVQTVGNLVAWMHAQGYNQYNKVTGPHSDVYPTACCGRNLKARIGDINRIAGSGPSPGPTPPSEESGAMEICHTPSGNGYWIVDSTGAVFAYGDAVYYGGANVTPGKLSAPIVSMTPTPKGDGYWLLGKDGGVFAFGKAAFKGAPTGKVH
jgi:hypothetical protein